MVEGIRIDNRGCAKLFYKLLSPDDNQQPFRALLAMGIASQDETLSVEVRGRTGTVKKLIVVLNSLQVPFEPLDDSRNP